MYIAAHVSTWSSVLRKFVFVAWFGSVVLQAEALQRVLLFIED